MSDVYPSIEIDGYTFSILEKKYDHRGYKYINIGSFHEYNRVRIYAENTNIFNFWIYASNSELGLWRLCAPTPNGILYKGQIDYVQTTLVHVKLQEFILENDKTMNYTVRHSTTYPCPAIDRDIKSIIENPFRVVDEEPFARFNRVIGCGKTSPHDYSKLETTYTDEGDSEIDVTHMSPDKLLLLFSSQLEKLYTFGSRDIQRLYPYSNMFIGKLHINGYVECVTLHRKVSIRGSLTNTIQLYYLLIECITHIPESIISERTIQTVCHSGHHIMPFLLTTPEAKCNALGLYDTYIPTGAFICKLFDYSLVGKHIQCTEAEIDNGRCNETYTFIGSRYKGVFPFKDILACHYSIESHSSKTKPTAKTHRLDIRGGRKPRNKTRTRRIKSNRR